MCRYTLCNIHIKMFSSFLDLSNYLSLKLLNGNFLSCLSFLLYLCVFTKASLSHFLSLISVTNIFCCNMNSLIFQMIAVIYLALHVNLFFLFFYFFRVKLFWTVALKVKMKKFIFAQARENNPVEMCTSTIKKFYNSYSRGNTLRQHALYK